MLSEHRSGPGKQIDSANAKITLGDAAELDQRRIENELTLKRQTRKYYREVLPSPLKSWPGLCDMKFRRITPQALKAWAIGYGKKFSPTRYNGTLSLLRRVFQTAFENGVLHTNPAIHLDRRSPKAKHLEPRAGA